MCLFNVILSSIVVELKYWFVGKKGGVYLIFYYAKACIFLCRYLIAFFIILGLGGNTLVSPEDAGCWEMANFFSLLPRRDQINSSSLCIWQCW